MVKFPDESQIAEAKDFIKSEKRKGKGSKLNQQKGGGRGFYGHLEGLDKPPKGSKSKELLQLLNELKSIKPFFKDKPPKRTPLVDYFYCRYLASWLKNQKIAEQSLDVEATVTMTKRGSPQDRYKTYCDLIEKVYGEDDDFLERLFPFNRVATIGENVGMLQMQYGMLRDSERKKFREFASKIKIPKRTKWEGEEQKYGTVVAYYLKKYLEPGTSLSNINREIPKVAVRLGDEDTSWKWAFLEAGAMLVAPGADILESEMDGKGAIKNWYFGKDEPSDEDFENFENETFTLQYLPSILDDTPGYAHYLVDPDEEDEPLSVYLKDENVFLSNDKRTNYGFEWVSGGDSFIPPNPKEYKSFEALGNLVEAQMAHFATVSTQHKDGPDPQNAFEEIHHGLLGMKNRPGIAVYHANIFYHLLLAQARDPIATYNDVDAETFSQGKLISLEAYLGNPLKIMVYWMMTLRDYVEFKGINPITETPRIITPKRISVSEAMIDEAATAEMANSLSRLMIAYYRCMFSMYKGQPFLYPKEMKDGSREKKGDSNWGKKARKKMGDFINLADLWDDLLKDSQNKGAPLDPHVMSSIVDYMYAKGKGSIHFPATMNPELGAKSDGWQRADVAKWLKFSYASNPTSVDTYVGCASALYAAINMSEYIDANNHVEGVKRFIETVNEQGGFAYLIAILSESESNALPENRITAPTPGHTYLPPKTRKNPAKQKKEAIPEQEYIVNIEVVLPVKIDLTDGDNTLDVLDSIQNSLNEEGIDDPASIGTNGKTLDMNWYVFGLDEAIEQLASVTEIYSNLGVAGRGWLEWGQEEMRENYTVDGYSYNDL